jgi:hypothetical protein
MGLKLFRLWLIVSIGSCLSALLFPDTITPGRAIANIFSDGSLLLLTYYWLNWTKEDE